MADKKKYRRSNGEGSVFKHQNGRWCGQISVGVDEDGKRKRKTVFADTRAEVVEQLKELHGAINAKKLKPSKNIMLGQFIDKWLVDFKRPAVSPRTYEWYLNMAKRVFEEIKGTYLHKINSYQIQSMLNTLKNEGLSVRSIKAVYDLLNQVFKAAIEFNMVGENPMTKVKITRKEHRKSKRPCRLMIARTSCIQSKATQHISQPL